MEWLIGKGKKKTITEEVKEVVKENKPYLEEQYLSSCILNRADIEQTISLPDGIDFNEWIASHTLGHFNQINILYGCIIEICTVNSCPTMSAPGALTYLWCDDKGKKTKASIAAPQYIDYVMTYVEKYVHDDAVFPSKFGMTFPTTFFNTVKKIEKLLLHVLAHLFCAHYADYVSLDLHAHLNCVFMNFYLFNQEFNILDPKETAPLDDLIQAMGVATSQS